MQQDAELARNGNDRFLLCAFATTFSQVQAPSLQIGIRSSTARKMVLVSYPGSVANYRIERACFISKRLFTPDRSIPTMFLNGPMSDNRFLMTRYPVPSRHVQPLASVWSILRSILTVCRLRVD
jgi:hypothetical protein